LAGIINEATRLIGTAGVKTSEVETRREVGYLPDADDGVSDEDKQDDKGFDECRYLVLRLLEPRKHLPQAK